MFGGADRSGVLGETWTFDASGWHERHPASSPSPREFAYMGFDPATSLMVLFGGITCSPPQGNVPTGCEYQQVQTPLHDTWTWDGRNWSQVQTRHAPATAAFRHIGGLAADMAHGDLLLVTWPTYSDQSSVETWTLKDGDWMQLHPAHTPRAAYFSGPAYDSVTRGVVLTGGITYWWDGADWRFELSDKTPSSPGTLVAVGGHGLFLIFGDNLNSWDGKSWSDYQVLPNVVSLTVHARDGWTASYFEPAGELILFGGREGPGGPVLLGDTVSWDGSTWRKLGAAPSSPLGALLPCRATEAISGYGGGPTKGEILEVDFYLPASGPCHLSGTVKLTLLSGMDALAVPNNPATQAVDGDLTAEAGGVVVTFTDNDFCSVGPITGEHIQIGDFDVTEPTGLPQTCPSSPGPPTPIESSVRRTPSRP